MKERLISRVGRIISGSFNSLVDAIENAAPETVMSEALREIDSAIDDVRAELGRVVANKHLAGARLMEVNKKHEDLGENIELAVSQGRDDLAEAAIARQLDIEVQIPVLETTIKECAEQEKELESYIAALLAKKRQMHEDLRQYRKSRAEAETDPPAAGGAPGSGPRVESRVEKAEAAFDRIMEQATGLPGSSGGGDLKSASRLAELEAMARKNRVQERLAAIKTNMEKK